MRTVITGEAVQLDLPAASVLVRGLSLMIDLAVYLAAYLGILLLFGAFSGTMAASLDPALTQAAMLSTLILCFVVAPVTVEALSRGRSLGRLILGVRVVRDDGGPVRLRHAIVRGLLLWPEAVLSMGLLPLLCGLLNSRGKRLGDMLAGTYGVLTRQPQTKPMMLPVPQHLSSWTQIADVGRVPDGLALRISRLLQRLDSGGRAVDSEALRRSADQLAAELRPHVMPPPPPSSTVEFLTAVMAERRNREYRRLVRRQERSARLGRRLHALPYT